MPSKWVPAEGFQAENEAAAWSGGRVGQGRSAGEAQGETPSSSTSNFSVALGGITPPAPRAP